MLVLGIETSCDETGVALYKSGHGILAEALHSQVELHADYGGVVPELASRDHIRKLLPLINRVMYESEKNKSDLDAIAYTAGPGLMGSLIVGATLARSIAFGLGIPSLAVHHMEGHLLAPMLSEQKPQYPYVALLVSGGHSQLIRVDDLGKYRLLGESVDDAAGEAFDKTANLLGLGYPGGPKIARCALNGDPTRFQFPRPMTRKNTLNMSFSGLKTHTLSVARKLSADCPLSGKDQADIARAFEDAVIDTLIIKCRSALQQEGLTTLVMAGGVSANQCLRRRIKEELAVKGAKVFYPEPRLCTDNGSMIAYAGAQRLIAGQHDDETAIVRARWPLTDLAPASTELPP